ncbi:MAG: IbrB-like domain-containing protein, partial [Candidatus Cryptobacteroides sp.]
MIKDELRTLIKETINSSENKLEALNELRMLIHELSPNKDQPVDMVRWVPVDMVEPNDYNPNSVAQKEMQLLYTSIWNDGYTQPTVTIWDDEKKKYVIVDGFHRYFTCKNNKDILERNHGCLPIVVINKNISERMAATVRHNRARGKHSVQGMSSMVFKLLDQGWKDEEIC